MNFQQAIEDDEFFIRIPSENSKRYEHDDFEEKSL